MSVLNDALKPLPNKDLQIKRIMRRRVFPCPSCGRNVKGCYAKRPVKKSLELADVVVPCPDCGTFTIATDVKKGKETSTVKETGAVYDRFSRVNAAEKDVMDAPKGDDADSLVRAADAYTRFAEELRIADPESPTLPLVFTMAVRCNAGAVMKGRTDRVNELARVMTLSDSISKYELLEERRNAFHVIEEHEDLLPPAVFIKLSIEDALVSSAFDEVDQDEDSQGCIEELEDLVREFDALPKSEKAESPYAAVDALTYIVSQHNRMGRSGNAASKKVVTAVRKARKAGAPEDAKHMNTMLNAYSRAITPKNGLKEKMLADTVLWSSPLYNATADHIIARSIVDVHSSLFGGIDVEEMTPEERSEVLSRLDSAIEVLDAQDDVGNFAWRIVDSYAMRGIVAGRKGDLDLAVDYISFFAVIGKLDEDRVMRLASRITPHLGFGSPTMKKLLATAGFPVYP
mgnify:CR=1 FL=1